MEHRRITVLQILLTVSLLAFSQVQYWVEVGPSYSTVNATNVAYNLKPSFRAGGFVRYDSDIESGVYFSQRSLSLSGFISQYADKIQKVDFIGNYLEIFPISIDFVNKKKFIIDNLSLNINAGFFASYCLGAKGDVIIDGVKTKIDNIYKDSELTINGEKYKFKGFRPLEFGVGIGYKLLVYDKYFFRLYVPWSFTNMTKYDKTISYTGFTLSLGYKF